MGSMPHIIHATHSTVHTGMYLHEVIPCVHTCTHSTHSTAHTLHMFTFTHVMKHTCMCTPGYMIYIVQCTYYMFAFARVPKYAPHVCAHLYTAHTTEQCICFHMCDRTHTAVHLSGHTVHMAQYIYGTWVHIMEHTCNKHTYAVHTVQHGHKFTLHTHNGAYTTHMHVPGHIAQLAPAQLSVPLSAWPRDCPHILDRRLNQSRQDRGDATGTWNLWMGGSIA